MTNYEALIFIRGIIDILARLDVKPADYKYMDLYREYLEMRGQGEKKTYIEAVLTQKWTISRAKYYTLLRDFGKVCKG